MTFLVERFPSLFYSVCACTYIYIHNTGMVNVIGIHPDCEISGTHPIQKKTIRIPFFTGGFPRNFSTGAGPQRF